MTVRTAQYRRRRLTVEKLEDRHLLATFGPDPTNTFTGNGQIFGAALAGTPGHFFIGNPQRISGIGTVQHFLADGTPATSFRSADRVTSFGTRLAAHGNHLLIAGGTGSGACQPAFVDLFAIDTGQRLHTFTSPTGLCDPFGTAITISSNQVAIAATSETVAGQVRAGVVYVYDPADPDQPPLRIPNPDPQGGEQFGTTITIVGDDFIIGTRDNSQAGFTNTSQVYRFDGATGNQEATYVNPSLTNNDGFGASFTTWSDNLVAIGQPGPFGSGGHVHIFDAASGTFRNTLTRDPPAPPTPLTEDNFGQTMTSDGVHLVVGAFNQRVTDDQDAIVKGAGQAYVFTDPDAPPAEVIPNPDPRLSGQFSATMAFAGPDLLIFQGGGLLNQGGAVYHYGPGQVEPPPLGLNQWWATVGEGTLDVTWTANVDHAASYELDIDIAGLNTWDLTIGAGVSIDNGSPLFFDSFGKVTTDVLQPGVHTFKVISFAVPSVAIVEEVTFQLDDLATTGIDNELVSLFIADWPTDDKGGIVRVDDVDISYGNHQELAELFAPIIFSSRDEQFPVPISIPSLQDSVRAANGDEIGADGPRGSSEDWLDLSQFDAPQTPNLTPTIYASILANPDNSNQMAGNYFFVTPRSNWADHGGFNEHEGDLEGLIVFFERADDQSPWQPTTVAFSQHTVVSEFFGHVGGSIIPWNEINRTGLGIHAYISLGGHSTYNSAGTTWIVRVPIIAERLDVHEGDGVMYPSTGSATVVALPRIDREETPEWLRYPGSWGNPDLNGDGIIAEDGAPRGIAFQQLLDTLGGDPGISIVYGRRWNNPWLWVQDFQPVTLSDLDGIPDHIENRGIVGDSDANNDGQPDRLQSNVATLQTLKSSTNYATLVTAQGAFQNVHVTQPVEPTPPGIDMPFGTFNFSIVGLGVSDPPATAEVTYILHDGTTPNSFWKYGKETAIDQDHWFSFPNENISFQGNQITVTYVDGGLGDADGMINGIITDPGAPAITAAVPDNDVTVTVKRGKLIIKGDQGNNSLTVNQLDRDSFQIIGLAGTTVNGSLDSLVVDNVRHRLFASLGDGDDTIFYDGQQSSDDFSGSLSTQTGRGHDTITYRHFRHRGFNRVNTGSGNDHLIATDSFFQGLVYWNLSSGDDNVRLQRTKVRGLAGLFGGAGTDTFEAIDSDLRLFWLFGFEN